MTYFISMLLLLITLPINAESSQAESSKVIESKLAVDKSATQVPHNNGTDGLLKNTIIEPIENFNSISKKVTPPKEKQQATSNSSALPTQNQGKVEIETKKSRKI